MDAIQKGLVYVISYAEALQRYVDQLQKTENLEFDLQKMFRSTWLFTCGLRWIW